MTRVSVDLDAAAKCARFFSDYHGQRNYPLPPWASKHIDELRAAMSRPRHQNGDGEPRLRPQDIISAKEVSRMTGLSQRTVQRRAADFDGIPVDDLGYVFSRRVVTEYVESQQERARGVG